MTTVLSCHGLSGGVYVSDTRALLDAVADPAQLSVAVALGVAVQRQLNEETPGPAPAHRRDVETSATFRCHGPAVGPGVAPGSGPAGRGRDRAVRRGRLHRPTVVLRGHDDVRAELAQLPKPLEQTLEV